MQSGEPEYCRLYKEEIMLFDWRRDARVEFY